MTLFNRKKKKPLEKVELIASKFQMLEQLEKGGLISLNIGSSRVFISTTLASCYIASDVKWRTFLTNVHQWFMYKVSSEHWNRYFKDVEAEAVRKARKEYAMLTKAQIQEIRTNARQAVNVDAVPEPEIHSFEFVITTGEIFTKNSEIVVVGTYNNGEFTMMPYEDIVRSVKP